MSDTPRTDEAEAETQEHSDYWGCGLVKADFARQLERELAAAERSIWQLNRPTDNAAPQTSVESPSVARPAVAAPDTPTPRTDAIAALMSTENPSYCIDAAIKLARQLERENAGLLEDAERYRFIRSNPDDDIFGCQDQPAGYNGSQYMCLDLYWKAPKWEMYTPEHLDRAVDAALKKAKP